MIDNSLYNSGEWWCNMVCIFKSFPSFNEYQGILTNVHFKRLWSIMHFNYHSNWKEVYVANASSLFETLNAPYSSALNTWSRCHITCEGSFTLFIRKMQSWWELIIIKMSCQSFISTGYHTTCCTLPLPSFQELNSNPRLFTIFILH